MGTGLSLFFLRSREAPGTLTTPNARARRAASPSIFDVHGLNLAPTDMPASPSFARGFPVGYAPAPSAARAPCAIGKQTPVEPRMRRLSPDIEFADSGEGPALLFLPGSFGTGAGWRSVVSKLNGCYRVVTTSLLGYGATAERRPFGNTTMRQQTEVIDAIFEEIAAPVHVVAHSFGGLSALAHVLEGQHKPASLMLVEANPLAILRAVGDEAHYQMFQSMTALYFAEFKAARPDAARHVIDFYGGPGAFDAMPEKVRAYVEATTASNIRDWSSGTPFAPAIALYGAMTIPTQIVRGGQTHPAMARIAEWLASSIPKATLTTLAGGSHFLPATHPAELADLIGRCVPSAHRD